MENLQSKEYESVDLSELFTALAKAQLEMEVAKQDSKNPFFKSTYADLASVVKASRKYLAKNGICVVQRVIPTSNGEGNFLHTRLCHSSGQWMEAKIMIKPPKHDIQTMGSYITYLRRYAYASMTGVVSSNEDDDGESGMVHERKKNSSYAEKNKLISKEQLEVLSSELKGNEEVLEALLRGFKISKLSDIPAKSYTSCIERVREINRSKNNDEMDK